MQICPVGVKSYHTILLDIYTKQDTQTCSVQCSSVNTTLEMATVINLTLPVCTLAVCMKRGNHTAATVGHCIIRLMMIASPSLYCKASDVRLKSHSFPNGKSQTQMLL